MIFSSNQSRVRLMIKLIVMIVVVFVVIIISIIASGSLSSVITTNYNSNKGATSSPIQKLIGTMSYNDIVQYALRKINEDRARFNIPAVKLSENTAAQLEAEDMLRTRLISHYTSDGMKPYMKYTILGGKGYVAQNVGYDGYNTIQTNIINKCKFGVYICTPIDPIKSIDELQYNMMHYDSIFYWSHRNNILDKHHTHVSIGIAYDKYSFVFVQNFENNYVEFDRPIIKVNNPAYKMDNTNDSMANIEISGKVLGSTNGIGSIYVYYDKRPTFLSYNQHRNDNFYDMGKLIADIVKQRPHHYKQSSSNYKLIQATKWFISSPSGEMTRGEGSQQHQESIDIQFNISSLVKSEGVYTIVVYLKQNNYDTIPATSYSIFFR
jgi:uncharacterized protein YkwD